MSILKKYTLEKRLQGLGSRIQSSGAVNNALGQFETAPADQGSTDNGDNDTSLLEKFITIDIETCSFKELSHIAAAHYAIVKCMDALIDTYNDKMEEFRIKNSPDEDESSWNAILEDRFRKTDSRDNNPEIILSPSMPQIFHELGKCVEASQV